MGWSLENLVHTYTPRGPSLILLICLLWLFPSSSAQRHHQRQYGMARTDQKGRQEGQQLPPLYLQEPEALSLQRYVRSPTVPLPAAVTSIVRLYGTPDWRRTRTISRKSTNVEHIWFTTELGKTVQWASHNLQRSWSGCPWNQALPSRHVPLVLDWYNISHGLVTVPTQLIKPLGQKWKCQTSYASTNH